jgi:peptide/nickel transport system permease protein
MLAAPSLVTFLAARLAGGLLVMWVVSVLSFGLYALAPGDPARLLLEASGMAPVPEESLRAKRAEMKLDEPILVRYVDWLTHALRGDLGRSFRSYKPVVELYAERLPATMLLAGTAATISISIAIVLGTLAAYRRGTWIDALAQLVAVVGASVPGFWMALIAIFVFAVTLRWLPAFGTPTPAGIVLPACVLALPYLAIMTRLTRSAMLDALGQEYATVARAKGLSTLQVARRHLLPNVLVPVLTVLGLELASLMTGAAVVEYVFAWPGIGKLAIDSVLVGDIPIVVGFAVAAGLVFVGVNLMVDIALGVLDPRVRRG